MGIGNVLSLLGGVSLFLFGIGLMGDSLKQVAGQRLELVLYRLTSTPLKGVLLGAVVTAVIQSSSATSAMVVGFVNSGMMKFAQAIGIILGANIGTSVTGWILCLSYISSSSAASLLSASSITAAVALVGILIRMLSKDPQRRRAGDILLGFAVLMYGMQTMSGAVSPLRDSPTFLRLATMFRSPLLGILVGALFSAVLQSNSASVGILQALSVTGTLSFAAAFPMIMGMGIGAAVPVLLSAIGANRDGRRAALIYLFNAVFGTVFFSVLFYGIHALRPFGFMDASVGPVEIALTNSLFRIGSMLVMLPFSRGMDAITGRIIPQKAAEEAPNVYTAGVERLEERFVAHPALAIEQSRLTVNAMAALAQDDLRAAFSLLQSYSREVFKTAADMEDAVDVYEDRLGTYLMKLTSQELTGPQSEDVAKYLHAIGDLERMSDHALNLAETAREIHEKNVVFTPDTARELGVLRSAVEDIVDVAVSAFTQGDLSLAERVEPLEEVIDRLCDELKLRHIHRMQLDGAMLIHGFVFNDLITNLERVADHCSNLAVAMLDLVDDSFDTHEYLIQEKKTRQFQELVDEYGEKYAI